MSGDFMEFKNSDNLTKWVKYFLYIQVVIATISILSGYMEYDLLSDYKNGVYTSQELAVADGEASDSRQQVIGIIFLINFIISGFLILKWIHRANFNSHQLGAENMEFTAGWSIGYFFIPIMTLFKPYQAMKEIWQTSHNPKEWNMVEVSKILPVWWTVWLINNFLGQIIFRTAGDAEGIEPLMRLNLITQASNVLDIFLAILTFIIICKIHEKQKYAFENTANKPIKQD
ncbi:MAG: DUF4328 domain-containing protein [Shewanella sp.]|nr:DUF4328 domain-containing protein [Shewanella sp.]